MSNKPIDMYKIRQLLRLYASGRGTKFISNTTGIARNTVKKYLFHFVSLRCTITTAHISLYMALWKKWKDSGSAGAFCFYRAELVGICKLSSYNCYHKKIKELHEYGYIKDVPSYNHFWGSLVWFIEVKK